MTKSIGSPIHNLSTIIFKWRKGIYISVCDGINSDPMFQDIDTNTSLLFVFKSRSKSSYPNRFCSPSPIRFPNAFPLSYFVFYCDIYFCFL